MSFTSPDDRVDADAWSADADQPSEPGFDDDGAGAGAEAQPTVGGAPGLSLGRPDAGVGPMSPVTGAILQPAIAAALAAPPGALSRDDLIGRTADVLHQALVDPNVTSDHFGDLVGRSVDVLSGLPDDEVGIREALGRVASAASGDPGGGAGSPPIDPALAGDDDDGGENGEDGGGDDPDGAAPEPAPQPRAAPGPAGTAAPGGVDFGELSRFEESGSHVGDPGAVSNGKGDPGGVSYGSYQLAVDKGAPQAFLKHEGRPWAARFHGLQPGAPQFSRVWKQIAATDRDRFAAAQKAFADRAYFQLQAGIIRRATGVDITRRSGALQNAVFSTAVQHGQHTHLIADAVKQSLGRGQGGDAALIDAIYAERARRGPGGVLVHFRHSAPSVRRGVAARLQRERGLALRMLQAPAG